MSAEECPLGLLHSTREELRGILSAEILLSTCQETFGGQGVNSVEFICDSKSALSNVAYAGEAMRMATPLKAEMDIIMEIEKLQRENDVTRRTYKWVKGHQQHDDPTVDEQLNDCADQLATECRLDVKQDLIMAHGKQFYDGSKAVLHIGGVIINKDYKSVILKALFGEGLKEYLKNKYEWN